MVEFENWALFETQTITTLERDENKYWKVTYKVVQKRILTPLSELEEENVSMTAHDRSMERALASATLSVVEYLKANDYNLFDIERLEDANYTN